MSQSPRKPSGYWKETSTQLKFMEDVAKRLSIHGILTFPFFLASFFVDITSFRDWYSISKSQFLDAGGGGLLNRHRGSLLRVLQSIYPDQQWSFYRFSHPHHVTTGSKFFSKTQHLLLRYIKNVSPAHCFDNIQDNSSSGSVV